MIGLDMNVLVRYLAQDEPIQSRKAAELLERRLEPAKSWVRERRCDGGDSVGSGPRLWAREA